METLNSKTYHAAVYLRLSREDGDVAEGSRALSNSISNQKELVMDYLRSHAEIQVYSVYTDDADIIGLNQKTFDLRGFTD